MEVDDVRRRLAEAFGTTRPPAMKRTAAALPRDAIAVRLGTAVAQAQWGYIAAAPGPGEAAADAWRLLLYILSHDYEGRLGRKAISEAGLAYYIDSQYRSDGTNAWVTLSTGVDPEKLGAFQELFDRELARLQSEPPTVPEVEEAKQHLLGRYRSAAQSNGELTQRLAREWLWYGDLQSYEKLEARLSRVGWDDVLRAVEGLRGGLRITVTE
jgi:predicted Zn-dependent peptidase